MSKYPTTIETCNATVDEYSKCYVGYAAVFETMFGEIAVTAGNMKDLHAAAYHLMGFEFVLDELKVQKVAIFDHNKIEVAG